MDAAQALFAKDGMRNVTVRSIVEAAGQKNESALQYHFGGRDGLIREIHRYWAEKILARRKVLLEALPADCGLEDIVTVMVMPSFELAKSEAGYRLYVRAFGPEVAMAELPAYEALPSASQSTDRIVDLLAEKLPFLSSDALMQRLDGAVRFASLSMAQHAGQKAAFTGRSAERFYSRLVDSLVGLVGVAPSTRTLSLED